MKKTLLMTSVVLILSGCHEGDANFIARDDVSFPVSTVEVAINSSAELVPVSRNNKFQDKFYKGTYELCYQDSKHQLNGQDAECFDVEPFQESQPHTITVHGDATIRVEPKAASDDSQTEQRTTEQYPEFTNEVRLSGFVDYEYKAGKFTVNVPIKNEKYAGVVILPDADRAFPIKGEGTKFYIEGEKEGQELAISHALYKEDNSDAYYGYYIPPEESTPFRTKSV